jgi:hypothetical protein
VTTELTTEGVERVGEAEVASGESPELPALDAVEGFFRVEMLVGSFWCERSHSVSGESAFFGS